MDAYSPEHLTSVWSRIRRHPVSGQVRETAVGVDGTRAENFEANLVAHVAEISRRVLRTAEDGLPAYSFAVLLCHEKIKPTGGVRRIHIARLRDQIVFRALHEEVQAAALRAQIDLRVPAPAVTTASFRESLQDRPIVLRTDIQAFYDSVPRTSAVDRASRLDLHPVSLGLMRRWDSQVLTRPLWMPGTASDRPIAGLPQGLSLSASLSELWISSLDQEARSRFRYFRYVDDIAVACTSVREAEDALDWLAERMVGLGLRLSAAKTSIRRIEEGVPWLGLVHTGSRVEVEAGRIQRWIHRFASIRRQTVEALRQPEADSAAILLDFHRALRDEIGGRTSSRPSWYACVDDIGEWRQLDRVLHTFIRSVYRVAGAPEPRGRQLPSLHRAIRARRAALTLSAPSTAEQGQCATIPVLRGTTAEQGLRAPDGAENIF